MCIFSSFFSEFLVFNIFLFWLEIIKLLSVIALALLGVLVLSCFISLNRRYFVSPLYFPPIRYTVTGIQLIFSHTSTYTEIQCQSFVSLRKPYPTLRSCSKSLTVFSFFLNDFDSSVNDFLCTLWGMSHCISPLWICIVVLAPFMEEIVLSALYQ